MKVLQVIPTKPLIGARRVAFRLRGSDVFLLLALIGGMSMSRGEEGTTSASVAAVVVGDLRDKVADSDKPPSAAQPAAAPVAAPTEGSTAVSTERKASSNVGEGTASEAKSDTAARAGSEDRRTRAREAFDGRSGIHRLEERSRAQTRRCKSPQDVTQCDGRPLGRDGSAGQPTKKRSS
jgi:hypothetical protein